MSAAVCGGAPASAREGEALSFEAMLAARAILYTLFHKAFGGAPTPELLRAAGAPAVVDAADEYAEGGGTMAQLRDFLGTLPGRAADTGFVWDVEAEYARHFVGPGPLAALPWESPYRTHQRTLFQENTLAVRAVYAAHGLEAKKHRRVPDDHVSLMFGFMAHEARGLLAGFRGACAAGAGRGAALAALRPSAMGQGAFVHEHLNGWLDDFARESCTVRALRPSTAHLYPQLAKGAAAFARLDEGFLAEAVSWVGGEDAARACAAVHPALREATFARADEALAALAALRLPGLEDNELVCAAKEGQR